MRKLQALTFTGLLALSGVACARGGDSSASGNPCTAAQRAELDLVAQARPLLAMSAEERETAATSSSPEYVAAARLSALITENPDCFPPQLVAQATTFLGE